MDEPPDELRAVHDAHGEFVDLVGTLDRIRSHGLDLVELIVASPDDWDRYEAGMWPNVAKWLVAHQDYPEASEVSERWRANQRAYLGGRRCLGWGVLVVRSALV